jgi:dTDP-4-dehydrorhamnose reductase
MKILITGGSGKLGKSLIKEFPNSFAPNRNEMNITNSEIVFKYIHKIKPEIVIHTAALVDVRQCENNKGLAWKTNVLGTENIVNAVNKFCPDSYFIYLSTACVFSGLEGNYNEESIPHPMNFYALTKLLGEFEVRILKNHLIIRTNFVANEKWRYPKAFSDRFGTYLFTDDVAYAIMEVIENKVKGIVHICGNKKMSMFELAKITTPEVKPMTYKEYSGPHLTKNMTLNTLRWKKYKIGFSNEIRNKKFAIS